ncbi:MAG TPA: hypothetical protein VGR00_05995, partial [Thermoanaerobaculia bacterium]|nr:hypothetical protein [Thermoanaerobaculia bacterium]
MGQPLGPEFRVDTYTTYSQASPRVASDAAGNFVVIWESDGEDGDRWGVFGQRYSSSGAPLGAAFQVNAYTLGFQAAPAVASDSAGNFVVVWFGYSCFSCNVDVFAQRYASGGIPLGSEFRVNTHTTSAQVAPAVAFDSAGNFVVTWASRSQEGAAYGDYYGIFGQRFTSAGAPRGAEFRVNTFTTAEQKYPSVASDPAGNFIVAWHSDGQDGSHAGVYGQRFSSAG